ncbi:hypothetical protein HDE_03508 [Halotydeus destructor]|nr:hypothetical protein HDE_03508 [Halotydeus destructor]
MADAGPILEHPMAKLGFTVMPQSKTIFGLRNRNDVVVLLYSTTDRDNLIWITGGAKKTPIMAISDLKLAFGTRELATVGPDGKKLDKRRDIHLLTHPLTEFGYRVVRMPRMNLNAVWDSEDKMVGFIADDDKDGFCRWDREGATKRETDMPTIKALLAKGRAEKKNAPAAAAGAANEEWRSITKPDAPVPKPSKKKQILKHTLNDCGCVATYSPEDGMYAMVDSKRAPLGLVLESEPTHLYHWNADNTIAQGKLVSEILAEENYKQLMGEEDEPASGSGKKKGKKGKGQPPAPEPAADSSKKKGKKAKDTNPDPVKDNVTQDDPQPDDPEDEPEGAVGGAPGKKKKPKKSKSKAQSGLRTSKDRKGQRQKGQKEGQRPERRQEEGQQ